MVKIIYFGVEHNQNNWPLNFLYTRLKIHHHLDLEIWKLGKLYNNQLGFWNSFICVSCKRKVRTFKIHSDISICLCDCILSAIMRRLWSSLVPHPHLVSKSSAFCEKGDCCFWNSVYELLHTHACAHTYIHTRTYTHTYTHPFCLSKLI